MERALTLVALTSACVPAPAEGDVHRQAIEARGVVLYTSPDGTAWARVPGTVHPSLQSLGLSVRPGGDVWVTGLDFHGRATLWERFVAGPPVRGMVFDGTSWRDQTWSVDDDDTVNFVDPQWLGDELWYVARPGKAGDPAMDGAQNTVRSAPPAVERLALPRVTDPSPVTFRGALHLFVTVEGRRIEQWTGDPLRSVQSWTNATVPFATVVGDELWLIAQQGLRQKRQPVVARSGDGVSWSDFTPMIPWDSAESCTSPVMGAHPGGGLLLLCVEEAGP